MKKALRRVIAAVAGFCITVMLKARKSQQGGMRGYITRQTIFLPMMYHVGIGKSRMLQTSRVRRLPTNHQARLQREVGEIRQRVTTNRGSRVETIFTRVNP